MSSYTSTSSSQGSSPPSSPSSSAMSRSISISSVSSQQGSFSSSMASTSFANPYPSCAYPSWPTGTAFKHSSKATPSAYVSDEDLFGDDDAYLSEPPPPPRPAEAYLAKPLLPPVVMFKPRPCSTTPKKSRRSSSGKSKE